MSQLLDNRIYIFEGAEFEPEHAGSKKEALAILSGYEGKRAVPCILNGILFQSIRLQQKTDVKMIAFRSAVASSHPGDPRLIPVMEYVEALQVCEGFFDNGNAIMLPGRALDLLNGWQLLCSPENLDDVNGSLSDSIPRYGQVSEVFDACRETLLPLTDINKALCFSDLPESVRALANSLESDCKEVEAVQILRWLSTPCGYGQSSLSVALLALRGEDFSVTFPSSFADLKRVSGLLELAPAVACNPLVQALDYIGDPQLLIKEVNQASSKTIAMRNQAFARIMAGEHLVAPEAGAVSELPQFLDLTTNNGDWCDDVEYRIGWNDCRSAFDRHLQAVISAGGVPGEANAFEFPKFLDPTTNNGDWRKDAQHRIAWNDCRAKIKALLPSLITHVCARDAVAASNATALDGILEAEQDHAKGLISDESLARVKALQRASEAPDISDVPTEV